MNLHFRLFANFEGGLAILAALVAAESTLGIVVGRLGLGGDLIFFLEITAPIPAGLLASLPTALARRGTGRTGGGPGLRPRVGPGLVGRGRRRRPRPGLRFGLLRAAGSLALTLILVLSLGGRAAGSLALTRILVLSLGGRAAGSLALTLILVLSLGGRAAGSLALSLGGRAAGSLALTLSLRGRIPYVRIRSIAAAGSLAFALSLRGRFPCVRIRGIAAAGSLALALVVVYF